VSEFELSLRPPLEGDYTEPLAWLDQQLDALGRELVAPVAIAKERPWATVLRAETDHGVVWLKISGAGTRFEVGLYDLLHRIAPDHVLEPLAIDVERAWIVLPDGGVLLADQTDEERLPGQLATAFAQYAELQLAVAPSADDLFAVGLTDMRATVMPQRFEEALEFVAPYLARRGTPDELAAFEQLGDMRAQVADWCRRLADAPGAASFDHNDLHPWNIFWADEPDGPKVRFYDWGDAVVAHPFASMLVGLDVARQLHGWADDDPRLLRIRDSYLEPFGSLGSHAELVETLELACRVGQIARALIWARAVGEMGVEAPDTYQTAPMEWLGCLLGDSYLGPSS
jgi:Phosphotransferase enzyme family